MTSSPKESRRKCLLVQGGEIGLISDGKFQSYNNFTMEIAHAVMSPAHIKPSVFGYNFLIQSSSGISKSVTFRLRSNYNDSFTDTVLSPTTIVKVLVLL
jgi:hypothetical protein